MSYRPYLDDPDEGLSPTTSHPAYVAAVPASFWSEDDSDDGPAPFGSDDGNDTLRAMEEHIADGLGDEHLPGCLADLIADWDLVPEDLWESDAEEIAAWLDSEQVHVRYLRGEIDAYIAGALAQFKISGWIHPLLRFWAERALTLLEHVLTPWEVDRLDAAPDVHAELLAATRAVLEAAPEPPAEFQLEEYA